MDRVKSGLALAELGKPYRFTSEQARLAGIKSGEARRPKRVALPEPGQDTFKQDTLACVREQIAAIQKQIGHEIKARHAMAKCACGKPVLLELPDSKRIKELTDSVTRLGNWERELSGRPLPGSLRPSSRSSKTAQPLDVQPLPDA